MYWQSLFEYHIIESHIRTKEMKIKNVSLNAAAVRLWVPTEALLQLLR